jgi:hypothetical protein
MKFLKTHLQYISFATINRYFSDWVYENDIQNEANLRDFYTCGGVLQIKQIIKLISPYILKVYQIGNEDTPHSVNTFIKL